jgi:large-conductance mechanosensitive channel
VAFVLFLVVKAMNKAKTIIVKDEGDDSGEGKAPLV